MFLDFLIESNIFLYISSDDILNSLIDCQEKALAIEVYNLFY